MKEFWDERFSNREYIYGEEPNEYIKEKLTLFEPGKILFPAEGEGRNAVYAAGLGWDANAFDQSNEGKKKADLLAEKKGVKIKYKVGDLPDLGYKMQEFDAIALVYAHFGREIRLKYHRLLNSHLRPGGIVIFEGFAEKHAEYQKQYPQVGGPKNKALFFSEKELKQDFREYEFLDWYEGELNLEEGEYHKGRGWVIRFTARKQ